MRTRDADPAARVRLVVVAALAALALASCGGGGGGHNSSKSSAATTTSSPSGGSAQAQITKDWEQFFDGKTPADKKAALLENGDQFASFIQQQAQSPFAQQTTAKVSTVTVNGQTADVTYTILVAGQPALTNQKGQAVLQNGTWKVGDGSFCALLALQGSAPSQCPSSSAASSATSSSTSSASSSAAPSS